MTQTTQKPQKQHPDRQPRPKEQESTSSDKRQEPRSQELESTRRERHELPSQPVLRFSPTAWAKLLYFRDKGRTEIGGFAVTPADDLLYVQEFVTVKQEATDVSISFDDDAVADYFEDQVAAGRKPEQFGRIWLHTHPADSAEPSSTDEETFHRVFGRCQWAVMFILARTGKAYARLRFGVGPGGQVAIPIEVDYGKPFGPSDREAWLAEYETNVRPGRFDYGLDCYGFDDTDMFGSCNRQPFTCQSVPDDWLDQLEAMEPAERQAILDELAARPDLWEESEVIDEY